VGWWLSAALGMQRLIDVENAQMIETNENNVSSYANM